MTNESPLMIKEKKDGDDKNDNGDDNVARRSTRATLSQLEQGNSTLNKYFEF